LAIPCAYSQDARIGCSPSRFEGVAAPDDLLILIHSSMLFSKEPIVRRTVYSCLGLSAACSLVLGLSATSVRADVLLAGFENTLDTIIPALPFHKDLTPDPPDATGPDILPTEFVCGGGAAAGVTQGDCALQINHPPDWGTDEFYLILSQGGGTGNELDLIDLIAESTAIQFDVTTFGAHLPQYRQIFFVMNTNYFDIGWYDANADPDVQLDIPVAEAEQEFFTTTVTLGFDAPLASAGLDDQKTFYQALAQTIKADHEDGTPVNPVPTFQFFMVFQGANDPFANPVQVVIDNFRLVGPTASTDPGDFDSDGDVDGRDLLVWQRNPSVGNLSDWQTNYGTGELTSTVAVPEPTTMLLVISLMMISVCDRYRQIC
jgi:hypothetical protein